MKSYHNRKLVYNNLKYIDKSCVAYLYFLRYNRVESEEEFHPLVRTALMKQINKTYFNSIHGVVEIYNIYTKTENLK